MVSIAGPCRKGKSYILSKVFDQGEVFPLGHELDPETMGIWMWIVPEKFQVYTLTALYEFPFPYRSVPGCVNKVYICMLILTEKIESAVMLRSAAQFE